MEIIENPYLYTLGILVAFFLFRFGRKKFSIKSEWGIILITTLLSLFSWFCVLALLFVGGIIFLTTTKFPDPPKWL